MKCHSISILRNESNTEEIIATLRVIIFKHIWSYFSSIIIKLLVFVLLFFSVISMTFDYLSYPYIYKLIVSDNNRGFDLPAISFCTERNVFFDKNKINEYFNSSEEYKRREKEYEEYFEQKYAKCFDNLYESDNKTANYLVVPFCESIINEKNNNLSLFYRPYEEKIFNTLSFDEMKKLTISANELFNCSAKLHFRNESFVSNATEIRDCFQMFDVFESIFGNDLGICYTFFPKRVLLKDDNYIEFNINYETQQRFLVKGFELSFGKEFIGIPNNYFKIFYIIDEKRREFNPKIQAKLNSQRTGLNADLNFRKTSVDLLSMPYMQKCLKYGMS